MIRQNHSFKEKLNSWWHGLLGPPDLEKLITEQNIGGLVSASKYQKDSKIRRAAIKALLKLAPDQAVEPLIGMLNNVDPDERKIAAKGLGAIGDRRAVEPLITALEDIDWEVREMAVEAIGQIGDERAIEPLIVALTDTSRDIRRAIANALENLNCQSRQDEIGAYYWIAKGAWFKCVEIGAFAVAPLISMLDAVAADMRGGAAEALGEIKDARAIEPLIDTLKDSDSSVREIAAEALGHIGDYRAVKRLLIMLDNQSAAIRACAAKALGMIGAPMGNSLVPLLKDAEPSVQISAAEALGELRSSQAVAPLIEAYEGTDLNLRQKAAEALKKIYHDEKTDENVKQKIISVTGIQM